VPAAHPYPYLAHLFGAYFHQDALDDGQTDEDVLREFSETSHAHDVLGTRADILRFLHEHAGDKDFLGSLNRTFTLDLSIGSTDVDARAWLARAESLLRTFRES
jgi:CdiI immunity protein